MTPLTIKTRAARVGDVFAVRVDPETIKCFQFIGLDSTQLNSEVIRAFAGVHSGDIPDADDVVKCPVEFYAHMVLKFGIKLGCWSRIGNTADTGRCRPIFRDSGDYGNPAVKVSADWYVWRINEEMQRVGRLVGENADAEIGIIINPKSIVHRMQTGTYDFVYPAWR